MLKRFLGAVFILLATTLSHYRHRSDDAAMIKKLADEILLNGKAYANLYTLCKTCRTTIKWQFGYVQSRTMGTTGLTRCRC